jgi:hypothetical protein
LTYIFLIRKKVDRAVNSRYPHRFFYLQVMRFSFICFICHGFVMVNWDFH